jgi:hypothetical protein
MDGYVAERMIGEWINFYGTARPHSSLGNKTLAEVNYDNRAEDMKNNWAARSNSGINL